MAIVEEIQDAVESTSEDDDNEFFKSKTKPSASEFELFLDSPTDEIAIYSRFPKLRQLFIEYTITRQRSMREAIQLCWSYL